MIILYHDGHKPVSTAPDTSVAWQQLSISRCLFELALQHDTLIVWCHIHHQQALNTEVFSQIFHHKKIMASYGNSSYLPPAIGYVEDSPFISVNKQLPYPTWQMSSLAGGMDAAVLRALQPYCKSIRNFDGFLNSLAKRAMPAGLLCYSDPRLFKSTPKVTKKATASFSQLFRFVAEHYKKRWSVLLLLNLAVYENKWPVVAFLQSVFYRQKKLPQDVLQHIAVQSLRPTSSKKSVDVVIPTLGRKKYLYDVLKDLAAQTHLPEKVIIVEQNPGAESQSELDYLQTENWPFEVVHHFSLQTGACRARNLALKEVSADWVFLADDDLRIENDFIEKTGTVINTFSAEAATFGCFLQHQKPAEAAPKQWAAFGSGCSFVSKKALKNIAFDLRFEHGYGEDTDFGMQLRNAGMDVLYFPKPSLLHLKAPIGGFRSTPVFPWDNEAVKPKPSPTVMLFRKRYHSPEQLLGYKTVLAFKFYWKQSVKNPFIYLKRFKAAWKNSEKWADFLAKS